MYALLIFIGLSLILLNTPWIQKKIIYSLTKEITEKSRTSLKIGSSEVNFLRGFVFYDVALSDSIGRTIISSDRIEAGINILPLFKKKLNFEALRLIGAKIYASKYYKSDNLNIQDFINSLKSGKKSKRPWNLDFKSVVLRNCDVFYDVFSMPVKNNGFDINHIKISKLSTVFNFEIKPGNNIFFIIKKLSAVESSGLQINNLKLRGKLSDGSLLINKFNLKSANSRLDFPTLHIKTGAKSNTIKPDSIKISPVTLSGSINPSDFSCFFEGLNLFNKNIIFKIKLSGFIYDIKSNINLNIEKLASVNANLFLKNINDKDKLSIESQFESVNVTKDGLAYLSDLYLKNISKTINVSNIETLDFKGKIVKNFYGIVCNGGFKTNIGNIETDLSIINEENNAKSYEGSIKTNEFSLGSLFKGLNTLGNVSLDLNTSGKQINSKKIEGLVEGSIAQLEYAGYNYKNIDINGIYDSKSFDGKIKINDDNANVELNGLIDFSPKNQALKIDINGSNINLNALNLYKGKGYTDLSLNLKADIQGLDPDILTGSLIAENVSFQNNGYNLNLKKITAGITETGSEKVFSISSDLVSGEAFGKFKFKTLIDEVKSLISKYTPSLLNKPTLPNINSGNNFDFHFSLKPSIEFAKVFQLPFLYYETINLDGFLHGNSGKFRIKSTLPEIEYGKILLSDINILIENPQNEAKLILHANTGDDDNKVNFDSDLRTMNNMSLFNFYWSNSGKNTHSGKVSSSLLYHKSISGQPVIDAKLLPTKIILNDTIWQIHESNINYEKSRVKFDKFQISHNGSFVKVDGVASALQNDTLDVALNSFRLDDIFNLFPSQDFSLGGLVTGNASCPHLLKELTLNATLFAQDFSINKCPLGDLNATSYWDKQKKAININADLTSKIRSSITGRHIANVTGAYYPIGDSINLSVDGNHIPLNFLSSYMESFLGKIEGYGSGKVYIKGPMKKIGVYTKAYVENVSFGIDMLNTRYTFSDSIFLSPQLASFKNIRIKDREGNIAIANGSITHDFFKDFKLDINVKTDKIIGMDIPVTADAYFSGIAYGSGTVRISGDENDVLIDVDVKTSDKTKAVISFLSDTEIEEMNFINFKNPRKSRKEVFETTKKRKRKSFIDDVVSSSVTVNLNVEATPNAELILITDPSTGDEIKAIGSGAIRSVINDKGDIELFGKYTIEKGSYKFIYQNLLRRDFNIVPDGTIDFSGNPFEAQLDIKANYSIDAQLTDLLSIDELSSLNLNRTNIPVNCVLNLSGQLQRPNIGLGIDFPSADEELKRRIFNVVNTEEQTNQQIVFLLLFGRFMSPTYNYATGQSGMSSVINTTISTLASQFNKMLNQVIGYSNLSLDFDYRNKAYELGTPGEWKLGMSGQWLDNRLTIEGNVGSRENLVNQGTSQFIGEFDANLRMKNFEKLSWKIFNRANDNRYFKSALNTQGVGVVYRENFNHPKDLFIQMVESIKRPFKKK
jgi:hypothetical protein